MSSWINKLIQSGQKYLLGGNLAGIGLAIFLALSLVEIGSLLGDNAGKYLTVEMLLIATGLIVQMILWMDVHAKALKGRFRI